MELVSDAEIVTAMRFLFEQFKVVAEPSGAVSRRLMSGRLDADERVGVIISGGNIGADRFIEVLGEGSPTDA